jgi:sec-independent protein translocase protein TatC
MRKRITESEVLTFTEHLEELRYRLLVCCAAMVVAAIGGYFLAPAGLRFLIKPLERANFGVGFQPKDLEIRVDAQGRMRLVPPSEPNPADAKPSRNPRYRVVLRREGAAPDAPPLAVIGDSPQISMIYLRPADPFLLILKVTLIIALILSLPVMIWQMWLFIAPGLTTRERKWAAPVIISGSLLFPIGVTFAYFLLTYALRFFARYAVAGLEQQLDVRAYLGFALTTMLSFGTVFELPVVVLMAAQAGLVSPGTLRRRRKEVFVLILIGSAILTPTTDPFTLMAMTLPLYALFEGSIWVAQATSHKKHEPDEAALSDTNET